MTLRETSTLLKIPEAEILRSLLRLAGRSRLTVGHMASLLEEAGVLAKLRLDQPTVECLAMATGRRITQGGMDSATAEYL